MSGNGGGPGGVESTLGEARAGLAGADDSFELLGAVGAGVFGEDAGAGSREGLEAEGA